jgi:hypothetical protein
MASFEIRWRTSTKKDLRSIPREEIVRIVDAVAGLSMSPDSVQNRGRRARPSEKSVYRATHKGFPLPQGPGSYQKLTFARVKSNTSAMLFAV